MDVLANRHAASNSKAAGVGLATIGFLMMTFAGQSFFALSAAHKAYGSALFSRALFGLGEGNVVVAQRSLVVRFVHFNLMCLFYCQTCISQSTYFTW